MNMPWIVHNLWLIPVLPLLAAAAISVMKRPQRLIAATLTIGAMSCSFLLALRLRPRRSSTAAAARPPTKSSISPGSRWVPPQCNSDGCSTP